MIGPGNDLPSLVGRKDHLGVLRYIRSHELREPKLVIEHGQALLGKDLSKSMSDTEVLVTTLEQICLGSLDLGKHDLAEKCLEQLRKSGIEQDAVRFRRLLARCLEASGDYEGATKIYDALLADNPANLIALQRKYCIARAQKVEPEKVVAALNEYLSQNMSDVSGWHEMAKLRMTLGDFKGAAYALEQVVLGSPLDAEVHRQLAEVYATVGGLDNLILARKHMSQSLELDSSNVRTQLGLVSVANQYLEESASVGKKDIDEHEIMVAKELVKYGASQVLTSYKGSKMLAIVKRVMDDYLDNLDEQH
jgi:tetratricopeptide (TPR) repeat protein